MPAEKLGIPLDGSLNTCILRDCKAQARSRQLVVFSVLENYYLDESGTSVPAANKKPCLPSGANCLKSSPPFARDGNYQRSRSGVVLMADVVKNDVCKE
jgi:hypothetical protein